MLGKPIPKKMREEMAANPEYSTCMRNEALHDHECQENPLNHRLLEWEHALTFGGPKINEKWAIISICYFVHRGGGSGQKSKEINEWIALNRGTDEDIRSLSVETSKTDSFIQRRAFLNQKYGVYTAPVVTKQPKSLINY